MGNPVSFRRKTLSIRDVDGVGIAGTDELIFLNQIRVQTWFIRSVSEVERLSGAGEARS